MKLFENLKLLSSNCIFFQHVYSHSFCRLHSPGLSGNRRNLRISSLFWESRWIFESLRDLRLRQIISFCDCSLFSISQSAVFESFAVEIVRVNTQGGRVLFQVCNHPSYEFYFHICYSYKNNKKLDPYKIFVFFEKVQFFDPQKYQKRDFFSALSYGYESITIRKSL